MKKKKICLLFLIAIISLFAFNANVSADISCSTIPDARIDESIPDLVSTIVKIIQIVVPILLVVLGLLDLAKGVASQKEDEIKKGQQTFIKRLIAGVLVFFVIAIVKLVVSVVAKDDNIMGCVDCFLYGSGHSSCAKIEGTRSDSSLDSNS